MNLCDIVFPQNLPFLTYAVPEELFPSVKAGQLVLAPLRGKVKEGIIIRHYVMDSGSFKGRLNEIRGIVRSDPLFSAEILELLEWGTDYYITNHGTMLKCMLFKEILKAVRKPVYRSPGTFDFPLPSPSEEDLIYIREVLTSARKGGYRTFLYQSESEDHEANFVLGLVEGVRNAIVLTPEIRDAELLYTHLRTLLGERVCIYHGEMKRTERYESVEGIYSGRYDIVVGTRPVVFAPLFSPSLIVVTREHNMAYKQEETPRYHGRDVAVMRGFIEKTPVVLTSVCPSIESFYNCLNKKYTFLRPEVRVTKPVVSLIDLKKERSVAPFLSKKLLNNLKTAINKTTPPAGAMVVIQRRGYAMLRCDDCGEIEECPDCHIPLVIHKGEGLICHLCSYRKELPQSCSRCSGFNLSPLGAGTERVEEELKKHLGIDILRVDSDTSSRRSEPESRASGNRDPASVSRRIVVGTLMARKVPQKGLAVIALLNPDLLLNLPEVRATERLVQEIFSLRSLLSDKGKLILQTEIIWHPVYRYLKRWDYAGFIKNELKVRRKNSMPPYTKLVALYIYADARKGSDINSEELRDVLTEACKVHNQKSEIKNQKFQLSGPFRVTPRIKGYSSCFQVILKDMDRQVLKECARSIKKTIEDAGMTLRIDVDPVLF